MFNKFITRSVRPLGMSLIFLLAIVCIFGSLFVRDIDSSTFIGKFLDYTVSFENRFYDYRMRSELDPNFKSKEIVLLKIDDYSLQKIGVWPIPRTEYAQMLKKLQIFGAKVVAMDIMFPEKSPAYGAESPDTIFAGEIKNFQSSGGRVFLSYTLAGDQEETLKEVPLEMLNDAIVTRNVTEKNMQEMKIAKFTFPIPELIGSEVGLGFINSQEDQDGIFRHYQLVGNVETIYYGSLGLNAIEAFTGEKNTIKIFADGSGELEIDSQKMELSSRGETKIRFIGAEYQFPEVSLFDVLSASDDDKKMKSLLEGKLVFVGSTAMGAHDLRPSPLDSKMPGVYSHLNMAHMFLHKYFYQNVNDSVKFSVIFLLLGMLLFLVVQRFGNPFLDALVIIGSMLSVYYVDKIYFLPRGYELKLFYTFFCFVASYSWNNFISFYEANKEKKQIKGTFARYVAPTIVDQMLKNPELLQVGGFKTDITCLFSDVRDFTSISEGLTATELAQMLNFYMGKMTDIVFDTEGTLDKYIGDAVVAIWGAPIPIGNHAQKAVQASILMMESMEAINEEFVRLGRPIFKVGIGLNSGECSVGNMGSSRIFSYTALGDNMNLGARLESLCKHYGAQILISEYTLSRLDQTIKYRPIDRVIVKGKTTPVAIYEVIHGHHPMGRDPELLKQFNEAYEKFLSKNFSSALENLIDLNFKIPADLPTQRLRDLCQKFLDQPDLVTENFTITKMTEK